MKNAVIARDGIVTYPNSLKATDVAVQSFQDSARVITGDRRNEAPSEFVYPVDVPAGGSMKMGQDGSVLVMDPDGLPRGGFAPPWAKDNLGRDVATNYELRRNTVVQVVAHHGADAAPDMTLEILRELSGSNAPGAQEAAAIYAMHRYPALSFSSLVVFFVIARTTFAARGAFPLLTAAAIFGGFVSC